jgi:hypothetical protein
MAVFTTSPYARAMTNRDRIERLRREVDVDYAFGVAGLLVLADAIDDLTARVVAMEHGMSEHRAHPSVDPNPSVEMVTELARLRRKIVKLTKEVRTVRKQRR